MMEPFLPRLLRRSGVVVSRVGEDIDYHGMRAPYFITTQDAVQGMPPELRELYDAIHGKFANSPVFGCKRSASRVSTAASAPHWALWGNPVPTF